MIDTEYLTPDVRAKWARRMPTGSLVSVDGVAEAVGFLVDPENRSSNGVLLPIDEGLTAR
jgi:NAD(P)-dependent dehydrogenase (short-subunit alcohol dehydrogenase family)